MVVNLQTGRIAKDLPTRRPDVRRGTDRPQEKPGRKQQPEFSRLSRKYASKQVLFYEGDEATTVYEVIDGTVMLYTISEDGHRTVIGFMQRGDYFGFVMHEVHSYFAQTVGKCTIRSISRARLWREIREHHRAAEKFLTLESNALEAARLHMTLLTRKTPVGRVAMFLLEMARRQGSEGTAAAEVHLPMTRADIADYLGLVVETVCRCLTHLKDEGVINMGKRGKIEVLDSNRLKGHVHGKTTGYSAGLVALETIEMARAPLRAWTALTKELRSDLVAY